MKKTVLIDADMSLDRDALAEAIVEGVRLGMADIAAGASRSTQPDGLMFEAIRDGTYQAIWHMITSGTSMPCADFYDTVHRAVKDAMTALRPREDEDA